MNVDMSGMMIKKKAVKKGWTSMPIAEIFKFDYNGYFLAIPISDYKKSKEDKKVKVTVEEI